MIWRKRCKWRWSSARTKVGSGSAPRDKHRTNAKSQAARPRRLRFRVFFTLQIGHLQLRTPFCQAGLAGYSDRAMRLVARRRGCPYAVTEALLDTILLAGGQGLRNSIDINDEDHPLAGQIIGSEPQSMARAAQILHEYK